MQIFIRPLLLTVLIETPLAYFFHIRKRKDYFHIILINVVTNLSLTLILTLFVYFQIDRTIIYWITYCFLEPCIILIEYLFFKHFIKPSTNCFIMSLCLNLASIIGGLLR